MSDTDVKARTREIVGPIVFWCAHHDVRLEVNEIGHVFFYEMPAKPGYFDIDTSGLMCPGLDHVQWDRQGGLSEAEDEEVEKCQDSWTMLEELD